LVEFAVDFAASQPQDALSKWRPFVKAVDNLVEGNGDSEAIKLGEKKR
jgi:hypothetical protein